MSAGPTREERERSFRRVQKYYQVFPEWDRLTRPNDGALEFEVNRAWISRYLPAPGARVLDIGGGPGRYAIWLAEQGYRVTLADLSADLLAIAEEKAAEAGVKLDAVVEANAIDLSQLEDDSFDATLCMGPMYHLLDESDRRSAARELLRATADSGTVFVAFLNRLQALRVVINPDILAMMREMGFPISAPANLALIRRWHEDGIFISPAPGVFTDSYFAHPSEIRPLMEAAGFETLELVASESIADPVQKHLAAFKEDEPEVYRWVLERLIAIANEPSIVGNAGHFLYIGRKP